MGLMFHVPRKLHQKHTMIEIIIMIIILNHYYRHYHHHHRRNYHHLFHQDDDTFCRSIDAFFYGRESHLRFLRHLLCVCVLRIASFAVAVTVMCHFIFSLFLMSTF